MPRTKKIENKIEKKAEKVEKKADEKIEEKDAEKKRVRHSYLYAVGRRKKSVARVRLYKKGEGKITVNGKEMEKYFPSLESHQQIRQPLEAVGKLKDFDFSVKVAGGGIQGQAIAIRHGIARTLVIFDKDIRATLKPFGYLTRDPRRKERKKPGLKRARRGPQWAKR